MGTEDDMAGWKNRQEVYIPPLTRRGFSENIIVREKIPPIPARQREESAQEAAGARDMDQAPGAVRAHNASRAPGTAGAWEENKTVLLKRDSLPEDENRTVLLVRKRTAREYRLKQLNTYNQLVERQISYRESGDYEQAEALCEQAVSLIPSALESYYQNALALYEQREYSDCAEFIDYDIVENEKIDKI